MFVHSTVTTVVGVVLTEVNTGNDPPYLGVHTVLTRSQSRPMTDT
jgi:hypothetical protein